MAIWIVNLINGFFSSWQEYKADRATEALRSLLPREVTVLRDGEPHRILAEALVPGDVVLLEEGDRVSADARLVEHTALRVDQSTLTGESRPVRKASEPCDATGRTRTDLTNVVFAGTSVAVGRGKAIATATGAATEFGRAAPERCVVVAVIRGAFCTPDTATFASMRGMRCWPWCTARRRRTSLSSSTRLSTRLSHTGRGITW